MLLLLVKYTNSLPNMLTLFFLILLSPLVLLVLKLFGVEISWVSVIFLPPLVMVIFILVLIVPFAVMVSLLEFVARN
jgi:hypothetical protein